MCACHYPKLIAAYHVLHRLLVPRHPSCALLKLDHRKFVAWRPLRQNRLIAANTDARCVAAHNSPSCVIVKELFSRMMTLRRSGMPSPEKNMVGVPGFEPGTSSLSGTRSNQLSYTPLKRPDRSGWSKPWRRLVELRGFEPLTSCLQSRCSSQLSYSP